MAISYDAKKRIFKLDTDHTSYLIGLTEEGYAGHIYYGAKLNHPCGYAALGTGDAPVTPSVNARDKLNFMDGFFFEYPTWGTGDLRESALDVRTPDGFRGCELIFDSYSVIPGKKSIPGMPSTFAKRSDVMSDDEALRNIGVYSGKNAGFIAPEPEEKVETLELTLKDEVLGLKVILYYTVFPASDAVVRSAEIINGGSGALTLEKAYSACIDMPNRNFERIVLEGSWARERRVDRVPVGRGIQGVRSLRGETSHNENNFLALVTPGTDEEKGEVYAMNFVYSGNFRAQAELSQHRSIRMTMGIEPETFSWRLESGESFRTPEAVLVYSDRGTGEMSRRFHDLYRNHLIRSPWLHADRPILVNNWEATYFNFDTEKLAALAKTARDTGIEMLVMDDGWFGVRNSDNCSLGDWYVNEEKLPGGLKPLVDRVNELGLKFGIWFEPEMISGDSDLYRAHPDWALRLPGRTPTQSREQYVLDYSRKEVRDAVYSQISAVLHSANIAYVKWDMNRPLSDLGSAELPPERAGELHHRFVLGVYDLQERLISEFPELLLENCSGGGGRFDPGMLYYSPQIWTSDDTDAIERLWIQEGTSYVYPVSTMGAHVSKAPNEQVGRMTDFMTRGNVALEGTFGYELDLTSMPEEERAMIPEQVRRYHRYHALIAEGDLYRGHSWDAKDPYQVWTVAAKDKSAALLTYVQVLGEANRRPRMVPFRGLLPDARYVVYEVGTTEEIRECGLGAEESGAAGASAAGASFASNGCSFYGDELMQVGVSLPAMGDFRSRMLIAVRQ